MADDSIDEVIDDLTHELERSRAEGSRHGYFQALYRTVTIAIARAIRDGDFDDAERMEHLDVRFARRYLDARAAHQRRESTTRSWRACFEAVTDERPIVLQHLLLAMNAHINLDLGIAAARTAPGASLASLEGDFNRINEILGSLIDETQRKLANVFPLLRPLDLLAGRKEERLVGFSMTIARDHAWRFAQSLAERSEAEQDVLIDLTDIWIGAFGQKLHRPALPLAFVQRGVRLCERGDVRQIIDWLS